MEVPIAPEPPSISKARKPEKSRSPSPMPSEGAGDVLSIEETNKLRAKLGLKPLEVGTSVAAPSSSQASDDKNESGETLRKDDWGEFYHKPAGQFNEKTEVELLREKIQAKKDKRKIEQKLARIKTLGESDSDDDPEKWVDKSRKIQEDKKKALARAKMHDEMDEDIEMSISQRPAKKKSYREKDLKGLKVGHDIESFMEERQVILTLKDQEVLADEGDTLINVNMIEDERHKKNVQLRKKNPLHYGYDVYEDQYDEFGNFIPRNILGKYDEDMDGNPAQSSVFMLGESKELLQENQRRAMEVKAKLEKKKLETLNLEPLKLASDHYTPEEMTKFKKPNKKIKKIRQKLRADDLLEIAGDSTVPNKDLGSRRRDAPPEESFDDSEIKIELEDSDLAQALQKARRLKQKEKLIKKEIQLEEIEVEVKKEEQEASDEEGGAYRELEDGFITLNQTAEFCRTLGDIPTYGMAGNRNAEVMEIEENSAEEDEEAERRRGKWNAVDPNDEPKLMEGIQSAETDDVAILDEEPDVASGVAAALQLAMSKGYIEKEESNRPSNTRFAHLQAQHYSIDDKTHGEDDKYARRGGNHSERFNGPSSEFREKPGYKPNVKLEYIDDNNQKLTPKEAFRYLSHKFHGKGPGKNKIEKRLKKIEHEVVRTIFF